MNNGFGYKLSGQALVAACWFCQRQNEVKKLLVFKLAEIFLTKTQQTYA